MVDADKYWMAHVGHRVVFKVTLHIDDAYDYYSGYIVALHDAGSATIALIEIEGERFWAEVDGGSLDGRSLTTSTRRCVIVVDEGKQEPNTIRSGLR